MKTLRRRGGTLAFCYYINRTFERAMDFQYKDSISAELHNNRKGTESMAKKKVSIPQYGTVMRRGIQYYRTRITDADGKRVDLYAETSEELYEKELEARRQVEEAVFRRKHPTVAEYCEKWLLMQSAKVSSSTLKGYTQNSTVLLVAQRVSTIMHADQILVLDEGRVVGKGTHKELLKTCPAYYEIASSQLSKEELE